MAQYTTLDVSELFSPSKQARCSERKLSPIASTPLNHDDFTVQWHFWLPGNMEDKNLVLKSRTGTQEVKTYIRILMWINVIDFRGQAVKPCFSFQLSWVKAVHR